MEPIVIEDVDIIKRVRSAQLTSDDKKSLSMRVDAYGATLQLFKKKNVLATIERGAVILCTRKRSYGTRIKVLVDLNKVTPAKWDQKKLEKYFVPAKEIWNKDAPKDGKGYGLNGSLRSVLFDFSKTWDLARFRGAANLLRSNTVLNDKYITAMVASWNVGNAVPPSNLSEWLCRSDSCDVVSIGCQECEYDPDLVDAKIEDSEKHWYNLITKTMAEKYVCVLKKSMWHIRTMLFVRKELISSITHLAVKYEATGIGHLVQNKGGIVTMIRMEDTEFCFVASHLAAHQEKVEDRNDNVVEIIKGLDISTKGMDFTNDHDYVFWSGDLNYRLDLEYSQAIELIKAQKWNELHKSDQLLKERMKGAVFEGFSEGDLLFPPTYKYDRGSRVYESELCRVPSWCDRVLVRSFPGSHVRQLEYACCDSIMTSDHSPIRAVYELAVRGVPPPLEVLSSRRGCCVKISNLKGMELLPKDKGNVSDPFIVFRGDALAEDSPKTKVVKETINPVWKDGDVPVLYLVWSTPAALEKGFVRVVVSDYDRFGSSDEMGQAILPLADLLGGGKRMQLRLTLRGIAAGVLEGDFALEGVQA